ncbi:MAG: sugar phosphate isomerase/epimerase [Kiritimatiellaeota bacterium]|nr:sugar phosphate isomerase/epimerase [Kiritimatiellota bacterium]
MKNRTFQSNRRGFFRTALYGAGFLAGSGCIRLGTAAAQEGAPETGRTLANHPVRRQVRIGGPLFGENLGDPEVWARTAKEQGYRAVYAPGGVSLNDLPRVQAFARAAEANDLVIAEVGRWVNLADMNEQKRKENFNKVAEGLALADELNARCCVDIAGSFSTEHWDGPHVKNMTREHFDLTVENARKLIDTVKPTRAKFAYEMMGWMHPYSPDSYLELLKAVDRKAFGVHVDICNIISSPEKFWGNAALIHETFDKLGPWIVSAHAKDLRWLREFNIHFKECALGEGIVDYPTYVRRLAALEQDAPLMIEHMNGAQEYARCRDFLLAIVAATK